ncbi:phage holin family protein [Patescibacteria group bacterium]|nr:phage holin family protein [Patescibacteria group bacterium]MBU1931140.1 phage holin family protein [Patescibacteria group bacterium]
MRLIFKWLTSGLAVFLTAYILPGVNVADYPTALIVALVLGAINLVVKPVLVILTLPINFLSLGLFTFVINALMIKLASNLVDGFTVSGFSTAILFSLVLSLVSFLLHGLVK